MKVRFLPDAEFERRLLAGNDEPTQKDRDLASQLAGELLALGLTDKRVDLSATSKKLDAATTVGFYDSDADELVVRGTDTTSVDTRVTIVHELTHALQYQHYDVDALYDKADEGSESLALDFLVEGDATAVENDYLDSLPAAEQDEYYSAVPGEGEVGDVPADVPYALDVLGYAPYLLGATYVQALDPNGGTKRREEAFRHPPTTEEVLIDPLALRRHEPAKHVPDPVLHQGEHRAYKTQQFGVITLYLMLATRLDARTALEAVTGWGGDRYVGFQRGGTACLRANITGDTAADTEELESALSAWKATMPAGAVAVTRARDLVTFTACEAPGVTEPSHAAFDSAFYNVLAGRIPTVLGVESSGLPLRAARCVGDRVSTAPKVIAVYDRLAAEGGDPTDQEQSTIDRAYGRAVEHCGVGSGG